MNLSSYDLIDVDTLTAVQNYASLGEHAGKLVISGVSMLPIQTVTLATEQTVAGYTFTTAGQAVGSTGFLATVGSIVSTLSIIGAVIAIVLTINSYLSSMWAVDSIKRQRDKVLTAFRKIKRLNRVADINKILYGNIEQYLNEKYNLLTSYENSLNDNNLIVRNFIPAKTNTYLLSNPIINFLQNEQNVLDIINTNNYKYIKVISFVEYVKELNILELDKIRIANADINTTKAYIDNLNALLVLIDKLENFKLYEQVIKDINYIKNNVNILLTEIKKTYIEQLDNQQIDNPLLMLEEITNDIPYLDLSAQTYDIGGLSKYPTEYISNDLPILLNQLNKKDLMILIFNNIYIKKFIMLMGSYYLSEQNLQTDTLKYINSAINTYNLLNEIKSLKILKEKNYNQVLPNNVNVDRYRIFTYFKELFIKKTQQFLLNYKFTYKKSNNVKVTNSVILDNKIFDLEQYFYNKKYSFKDFLYYFDFNTTDENQKINNINLDTIEIKNLEQDYFTYIKDIRTQLNNYGIDIVYLNEKERNDLANKLMNEVGFYETAVLVQDKETFKIPITNFKELISYFVLVLTKIQTEINNSYEACSYKTYTYNYENLSFNNKLIQTIQTKDIRIKNCILIEEIVNKMIEELEAKLYQIRQDYKYEYSIFGDLFLSEQSYFLFELFTKLEQITNSSVALIKDTQLSITNAGYNINFYDILFEFFTKYINNYSGYIYSKNNYLKTLTDIAQVNFISILQIACDYISLNIKLQELEQNTINLKQTKISQTELKDIINLSTDINTTDILANTDVKEPDIKQNSLGKIAVTVLGVALLSN